MYFFFFQLVPPIGMLNNPMNAVTTKFVRTSTNKVKCPVFVVRVSILLDIFGKIDPQSVNIYNRTKKIKHCFKYIPGIKISVLLVILFYNTQLSTISAFSKVLLLVYFLLIAISIEFFSEPVMNIYYSRSQTCS